jgi:hypothetical protein
MKKILKWIFTFLAYALGTVLVIELIRWLIELGKIL